MKRFTIFLFFLLSVNELNSAEIKITSEINKEKVKMGEEFTFTVTVIGNFHSFPEIKLPDFSDFFILSSQKYSSYNIKKGNYEVVNKYEFNLLPKKPGIFSINPVELKYKNKLYKTKALTIEVIPLDSEKTPSPGKEVPWKNKKGILL